MEYENFVIGKLNNQINELRFALILAKMYVEDHSGQNPERAEEILQTAREILWETEKVLQATEHKS